VKDDYVIQRARIERLAKEMSPNCLVEFDPDNPPTWIKLRITHAPTGTILAVSSGDWHVTEIADKSDDQLRALIKSFGAGRI